LAYVVHDTAYQSLSGSGDELESFDGHAGSDDVNRLNHDRHHVFFLQLNAFDNEGFAGGLGKEKPGAKRTRTGVSGEWDIGPGIYGH